MLCGASKMPRLCVMRTCRPALSGRPKQAATAAFLPFQRGRPVAATVVGRARPMRLARWSAHARKAQRRVQATGTLCPPASVPVPRAEARACTATATSPSTARAQDVAWEPTTMRARRPRWPSGRPPRDVSREQRPSSARSTAFPHLGAFNASAPSRAVPWRAPRRSPGSRRACPPRAPRTPCRGASR